MTTYRMWLQGGRLPLSVHVTVDRTTFGATAYGLALDEGSNVRAETKRASYSGFCDAEIVYDEIHRLLAGRWGFESEDIAATLERHGLSCTCEEED